MQDYARRPRDFRRHALGLGLVVVLHGLIFWAIQSGLSREVSRHIQVVADVLLLSAPATRMTESPPRPPSPAAAPVAPAKPAPAPTAVLPQPPAVAAVVAPAPVATTPTPPSAVLVAPSAPAAPAPSIAAPTPISRAEPVRTAAVVNAALCEKPEYPSASRRMEEEGTVHLRFLIGVDGRVIQAEVEKSSGFKRLDEAARAGLSRCQFRPATVDGRPEQAWASMRYTWRLE